LSNEIHQEIGHEDESTTMKGYYQLIEGHDGGFMFSLRAGNHETVLESRVFWSRQAAMDAVQLVRDFALEPENYTKQEAPDGTHFFELRDSNGKMLGRGASRKTRSALNAGIASVQRNAPAESFRGLVRRALTLG
jgi:uncharacterized protein